MAGASHEGGPFQSPEEELAHLRRQVEERERALEERYARAPTKEEREQARHEEVRAFREVPQEHVLPPERQLSAEEAGAIVLELPPDEDDRLVGELLGVAQERGIKNALTVVERMQDPHVEDDFHRALVAYIATGYPAAGLAEGSRLWESLHMTLFEVSLPRDGGDSGDDHRPLKELISGMEQFYAGMFAIAGERQGNRRFTIELAVSAATSDIVLYCAVPTDKRSLFHKHLAGLFPEAQVREERGDYNIFVKGGAVRMAEGSLARDMALPLKTYDEFDHDPLNVLINALSRIAQDSEGAAVQLVVQPAGERYVKRCRQLIEKMERGTSFADARSDTPESLGGEVLKLFREAVKTTQGTDKKEDEHSRDKHIDQHTIDEIRRKIETPVAAANIRIAVSAQDAPRAETILGELVSSFNQYENPGYNRLTFRPVAPRRTPEAVRSFTFREHERARALPLSLRELSSLLHFPSAGVLHASPEFKRSKAGVAAAPSGLATAGTLLGVNTFRGVDSEVYLADEDRLRHFYVIGQTGTGKTTLLKNMIMQDIQAGHGVCMIDPHGSDVMDVLASIPAERHNDLLYFDPGYTESVMGLNMLEYDPARPEQKTFVVNELFSIFQKLYAHTPEAMGPAFEQYFRNAAMLVLEDPASGNTLLDISRVLSDERYRALKLSRSSNPVVNRFWSDIAGKAGGEASLANIVPYITNKFDIFTANEIMRPIIAQPTSTIDFRRAMDERAIVLVNLSKGKLGDINAHLIGLILVGKILMAALSRVDAAGDVPPFHCYIDEFQNITTSSISTILSEARKYKVTLTLAHQYIAQLEESIRDAVFGNVGSLAAFRVGSEDAKFLESQFAPTFSAHDLMNVDNHHCYAKLLAHGTPLEPFNMHTLKPPAADRARAEYLKQLSYTTYGRPREEIDTMIRERYLVR